jgi:bifunctional DNase/RNase
MKVTRVILDPITNNPIVLLRDENEKWALPIWIGLFEANAITMSLENIVTPRPMTHDLIKNMLETLKVKIEKVVVRDLIENTFYASIYLETEEGIVEVDSRPSDAIAIALRMGAPIYVKEEILKKANCIDLEKKDELLKEWLENLDLESIQKFKI